ncbi:signal recognition particle receptor subunit alpha, partial [Lysobacter xanthus]
MLSFLRRKKPDDTERRMSPEEIAAAFGAPMPEPDAEQASADDTQPVADAIPAMPDTAVNDRASATVAELTADIGVLDTPTADLDRGAAVEALEAPFVEPAAEPVASMPVQDEADVPGASPTVPAAAPGRRGWLDRLRGNAITRSLGGLFSRNPKLDDDLLDEIETALITADVGVTATTELVERLRRRMKAREFADAQALLTALRADLLAILEPVAKPLVIDRALVDEASSLGGEASSLPREALEPRRSA